MTASASGTPDRPGRNARHKTGLNRAILDNGWHKLELALRKRTCRHGTEPAKSAKRSCEKGTPRTDSSSYLIDAGGSPASTAGLARGSHRHTLDCTDGTKPTEGRDRNCRTADRY
jgi:hypothetical protein